MFQEFGRAIIFFGVVFVIIGTLLMFVDKTPFLGKLPGDILIKRKGFTFFAPITTSIILSILLSIILMIISNLRK